MGRFNLPLSLILHIVNINLGCTINILTYSSLSPKARAFRIKLTEFINYHDFKIGIIE